MKEFALWTRSTNKMSSTLNRKHSSASLEGRRNSEDGLLSASGTLRRAAAIPVMEEDNALSPLKQLQRLNQNGSFRVVAKTRPSLPIPTHVRNNSFDKSSLSSSSSSSLSLESSGKRSDVTDQTDSCLNNNVDKPLTSGSSENVSTNHNSSANMGTAHDTSANIGDITSPNHNDNYSPLVSDGSHSHSDKPTRSDTNGNLTSEATSPYMNYTGDKESHIPDSEATVTSPVTSPITSPYVDDVTKFSKTGSGSGGYSGHFNFPSDQTQVYDHTEKSFCPLALDLHPHQSHFVDYERTYGVPESKSGPPAQSPGTTQQVTVEVHRTDSPDDSTMSSKSGDKSPSPNECEKKRTETLPQSDSVGPTDANNDTNVTLVTSPGHTQIHDYPTEPRVNKPLSPVSEGPVILIHGEGDYDVPRTQVTQAKSPTTVTPTRSKSRLSRPKCKAPPPPTSPRTASIRDSLCSSSSTHSVNSSASSHSESVTSHSSGISSSGSALSQCSQSTLTSDGEGHRSKVIEQDRPRTPSHYARPKGPAPPPPANRKPARPPPIVFHERAVSEPKETITIRSPEGYYDVPRRLISPHSPRPASVAPSWKCPGDGHYDVVRSPEAVSPLSRNVEVRRSTLGTTGEIKVTPIPRDTSQCSTFLTPITKPVIDVKLIKNERKPTSPYPKNKLITSTEEMNTLNRQRMSRSAEELDKKYVDFIEAPPPRPISPTVRNSFMGSDVEIPREAVYNSIGEVNTILKTAVPEKEKIYSLPQPQCYGDDTLKAVKAITEKYDTLERHRQRAVSFRENSRPSISSSGAKSEPTSPMVAIQEVSASDPMLSDATDFVFPEGSQTGENHVDGGHLSGRHSSRHSDVQSAHSSGHDARSCGHDAHSCNHTCDHCGGLQVEHSRPQSQQQDIPGSPEAILDMAYGGIQARDISRIDLFYRGQGTEVVVCSCMASLSIGIPSATCDDIESWEGPTHTGVPVIVFNTGAGKRSRELCVVLAERETGFPLWQDKVSYLTNYHQMSPLVHALSPANNLRQKVAITFMQEQAAQEFFDKYKEMTANPNDDLWKISNAKKEKKHRRLSFRRKKNSKKDYNKTEISKPCNFTHLTNIDPKDRKLTKDIGCHDYDRPASSSEIQQRKLKTKTM